MSKVRPTTQAAAPTGDHDAAAVNLTGRWDVATLRAAWWTRRALARARRRLRRDGLAARINSPPPLPPGAIRGVRAILRRQPNTCLERALVLQRWLAAHDAPYDVVVGVSRREGFQAHAWLEFESTPTTARFSEITRLRPR